MATLADQESFIKVELLRRSLAMLDSEVISEKGIWQFFVAHHHIYLNQAKINTRQLARFLNSMPCLILQLARFMERCIQTFS